MALKVIGPSLSTTLITIMKLMREIKGIAYRIIRRYQRIPPEQKRKLALELRLQITVKTLKSCFILLVCAHFLAVGENEMFCVCYLTDVLEHLKTVTANPNASTTAAVNVLGKSKILTMPLMFDDCVICIHYILPREQNVYTNIVRYLH